MTRINYISEGIKRFPELPLTTYTDTYKLISLILPKEFILIYYFYGIRPMEGHK